MAQKQKPEITSTLAFEKYTASAPILSSANLGWQNIIVRTYIEPESLDNTFVPAIPDPYITLLASGTPCIEVREQGESSWTTINARAGDLFFTAGGSPYFIRWKSKSNQPIESVHIHLDTKFLTKIGEQVTDIDSSHIKLQEKSAVRDPFIEQICLTLKRELEQGFIAGKLYAESAAQFLAVHLLREHCTFEHNVKEYSGGLSSNSLRRVINYVKANIDTDFSLDDLAQQTAMSTYHFCRLFKQSTGESPNQLVVRLRIEEAQRLLKETNLSVLDIAGSVGYNSPSHLATQFRRFTGVTPSAYRKGL
jgi:AraC family transcriptional regulator